MPRGDHRHQRRRRATGCEKPARLVRHPEPLPEPVDHGELDLIRPRSDWPDTGEEVVARREPISQHRREGRNAGDVAEEARVRLASVVWKDPLGELIERGVEPDAL